MQLEERKLVLKQDIMNGKIILGALDEICNVENVFEAYNKLLEMNPYSVKDMLIAL